MGETVGELLARLDMIPGDRDVLSHSPDTPVTEGMEIRLDSLTEETQTYTACIPHTTRYCGDASLPEGVEEVRIPGRDGQLRCTARVTYVNGEERDREITEQVVTSAPVEEVIVRGTGTTERDEPALAIGENTITLPTGEVLTYTHTAQVRATAYSHLDEGCDFITATGTRVRIGTVAVDPRFIPYGTRMFIVSNDGTYEYGISVAEDCGGAIKGNRVDLYFPTYSDCMAFGRRNCTVYFLG
jgi:3D (Asp-Asp-Asp) domain-containing protein